jgi:Anti-sigma factor NepR
MDDFELLSGYLDGALSSDQRATVEARLANEPTFAASLAELRESDATLRSAYDGPMTEPVPQRFLDLLGAQTKTDSVIHLADHRQTEPVAANDNPTRWRWIGGAVAASLAIGLFASSQFPGSVGDPRLGDMTAFNTSLDKTPSARAATLSNGRTLTPQLSFAGRDGGYCRQFTVSDATHSDDGLACREGTRWQIKALFPGKKADVEDGGYETAGGGGNEKLDAITAKLRGGDPMDPAQEAALITSGWK